MNPPDASERNDGAEEDPVARLLQLAGHRPSVSPAVRRRSLETARGVWRAKVRLHTARRRRRVLAIAAGWLLAVAGAGLWWRTAGPADQALGRVAAISGKVSVSLDGEAAGTLVAGGPLVAGLEITTGAGHAALDLDGASVRVDRHSRVRLESERRVSVAGGAVYVDSGSEAQPRAGFEVMTPFGTATDIGTQFEVRLEGEVLEVRVREGEVRLDRDGTSHLARAGEALRAEAGGSVERSAVGRWGMPWEWVLNAAPAFELEGRTVRAFLDWVCRETGWSLRFEDAALESSLASDLVHGSGEGLRPDEILALVMPTAGLDYRVEDGVLHVERSVQP